MVCWSGLGHTNQEIVRVILRLARSCQICNAQSAEVDVVYLIAMC